MIYTTRTEFDFCIADTRTLEYYSSQYTLGRWVKVTRSQMAHLLQTWRHYQLDIKREC